MCNLLCRPSAIELGKPAACLQARLLVGKEPGPVRRKSCAGQSRRHTVGQQVLLICLRRQILLHGCI